ncbi:MAG: putative Methionyl-tRNA formyltransferase [Gammaproteobacteria bacterium]|jgi:methionyl-tRNA formyltransferase|nr:putative Methionyl-tRNA formyltransferase [Gammaproteobacteria bacterium]
MNIFLFLGSRRGHAVLKKLMEAKATIGGILCLVEDLHEEIYHPQITTIAKEHGIPLFYSTEVKTSDYPAVLKKINPTIAFAIGWRYLIPKEAYTIPKKGTLILHDSLLPTYRGFAPMNWAIINGETKTGVTLFHIAEGVDCGPIVDQLETDISLQDTARTVDEKIIGLYEKIIIKNLPAFTEGRVKAVIQNEALATYTCKRTPEDGEINWHHSALQIYNLIRALTHPFPGAYTTLRGKKIWIWAASLPVQQVRYIGCVPGRIIGKRGDKIEVLTGDGVLQLSQLQFLGEEEKSAGEFSVSVKDTFS